VTIKFPAVDNVGLVMNVSPDPLNHRPGSHEFWLNNNNSWIADIGDADVSLPSGSTAHIELLVAGAPTTSHTYRVGQLGAWRSSQPLITAIRETAMATAAAEMIEVRCTVARARLTPSQLPAQRRAITGSIAVNL
jgi:hypothetical protein